MKSYSVARLGQAIKRSRELSVDFEQALETFHKNLQWLEENEKHLDNQVRWTASKMANILEAYIAVLESHDESEPF